MLPRNCKDFRDACYALVDDDGAGPDLHSGHGQACEDCQAWVQAFGRRIAAVRDTRRLVAPAVLATIVAERLASAQESSFDPRVGHVLSALPELEVPDALASRLREDLENEPIAAGILRSLEPVYAPSVLERLLSEELADPGAASARRFAGDLQREAVPSSLTHRVANEIGRFVRRRHIVGSLATLAAAALVLWIGVRRVPQAPEERYSFQVRRVQSTAALDGLARTLGDALSGGVANAVPLEPGESAARGNGGEVR